MKRGFAAQFGERFTRRLFGWLKFLSPHQATGYFGIFTRPTRLWYRTFALKRIFYFIWIHPALPRKSGFPFHSNKQRGIQI